MQTFDSLIVGAEVVARSVNKSKPKVERTYFCSKTADSDRRISTGRLFQTDGAAWLKARLAIYLRSA